MVTYNIEEINNINSKTIIAKRILYYIIVKLFKIQIHKNIIIIIIIYFYLDSINNRQYRQ